MKLLIIFCFATLFIACNQKQKEIKKILKDWYNKEIIFPSSLQAKIFTRDTINEDWNSPKYKILLHVDSTGCSACKLQLYSWLKFMERHEKYQDKLAFIYVVHVLNSHKMAIICKQNNFNHPIIYDINGQMDKINNFPKDEQFRCFLLDTNNKVKLIGNPVSNPKLEILYDQIISK